MTAECWTGHGFGFVWIFPVVFLAVPTYLIRGMFGQNNNPNQNTTTETAREILDKRFARVEIHKEEYAERKRTLSS